MDQSKCWNWPGNIQPQGYGQLTSPGYRGKLAHRAVWELLKGPIHKDHEIHHTCCNKQCVNPDHLMPVTRSEHMSIETRGYCRRKWFGGKCPNCGGSRAYPRVSGVGFRCRDCDAVAHKRRKNKIRVESERGGV